MLQTRQRFDTHDVIYNGFESVLTTQFQFAKLRTTCWPSNLYTRSHKNNTFITETNKKIHYVSYFQINSTTGALTN